MAQKLARCNRQVVMLREVKCEKVQSRDDFKKPVVANGRWTRGRLENVMGRLLQKLLPSICDDE